MGEFSRELKQMVWLRDNGACVRCGVAVWQGDIHHRRPRMAGGGNSREEWINDHSNLLLLSSDCHRWVEEHRDEARRSGWLVGLGEIPEDVPARYHDGLVYRLHGDFFLTPVTMWRDGMDVRELVA